MRDIEVALNPNPLVKHLRKPASEFTKQDIMKFIQEKDIQMINFRYVSDDGKLKALNFVILNKEHLDQILTAGERVDGSSLFSFIEAGSSDLYVIPKYRTAFVNPFELTPTLDILCGFYTNDGKPLESSPEYILRKAHSQFKQETGFEFKAMGELEYYIISEKSALYPTPHQKGYHESAPFAKWEDFRKEAMQLIARCGGMLKYGHSEVGNFSDDEFYYEQQEIEFLPVDPEEAVDQLIVGKWILRMLAYQFDITLSFAPKITVGHAGSGLHIHMLAQKDGKNLLVENGKISDIAKRMIGGLMDLSTSLTAFGNTIPTSYLRLVPHQEAPTYVCWGDRNRSALVRVPLGWLCSACDMITDANPLEARTERDFSEKQSFEFRVPDGSANLHYLMAGMLIATRHGLTMENSLELAEKLYAPGNIFNEAFKDKLAELEELPSSCFQSAEHLANQRFVYEDLGVFPKGSIDAIINKLKAFDDDHLSEKLFGNHEKIRELVNKYLHWM